MARKITALKLQKRNPHRVNVYLDGQYAFGLAKIVAAWLQVGAELTDEKITQLQAQDQVERAYLRALNLLNTRPRAEAEVVRNLRKHETPQTVIDQVIARLHKDSFLDDRAFAHTWVENRAEFRPRGRRALQVELRRKGISDHLIEEALQDIDEETLALKSATKAARKLKDLPWPDFRKKLYGHLARRGFGYAIISEIIPQVWGQLHPNTVKTREK